MATSEPEINVALAEVLNGMRTRWSVVSEPLRAFTGNDRHPDVLITQTGVAPLIVETEVLPATSVEKDALARLGETLAASGATISSVIAARLPVRLREISQAELRSEITSSADLEYALYTGHSAEIWERFPTTGWLVGYATDLADLIQAAAVSAELAESAATILQNGVNAGAGLLGEAITRSPDLAGGIRVALRQEDGVQTRRMAITIVTNAFIFHENLAGSHGIRSVDELRNELGVLPKTLLLDEWRKILQINYYPIFQIACNIVIGLPQSEASQICDQSARTAAQLVAAGVTRSHDLTGTVFQKLIADRKFLATFYTKPQAAALLAGLAVPTEHPKQGGDWGSDMDVKNFIVADFACGTGTLLSGAYQRIIRLHEGAGGDSEAIHAGMMENALVGCDVMPSAVHLTASMLASTNPAIQFLGDRAYTFPYGKQGDGQYALGSLDLLGDASGIIPLFRTFSPAIAATGTGEEERPPALNLPPGTCDLVIMNPPFTRPTNHEGMHSDVPNPAFAAFGSDPEEQLAMSKLAKKLGSNTCANGNAGIASHFVALADRMVKQDGTIGLVLPLVSLQGAGWQKARDLWLKEYSDITAVTLAGIRDTDSSFSADTGFGETLLVARKGHQGVKNRGLFLTLIRRPESAMEGSEIARSLNRAKESGDIRRLEDGPFGGTQINVGRDKVGEVLDAPICITWQWSLARVADMSLAQSAYQLANGRIWLPESFENDAVDLPMTTVGQIAARGFLHRDINEAGRGPFEAPIQPYRETSSYPTLWNHNANRERCMATEPDSEARVRQGMENRAAEIWATRSHAHHNADFRFNSQSLSVAYTERESLGGRAWPNVIFDDVSHEIAFTVWSNSILGMVCYWWHSTKAQSGRGSITITALESLPTLDVRQLDSAQLDAATEIFNDMKDKKMLPMNEARHDEVRRRLDQRLITEVLNLDSDLLVPLELLRRKLCAEPSVHGGKISRAIVQQSVE